MHAMSHGEKTGFSGVGVGQEKPASVHRMFEFTAVGLWGYIWPRRRINTRALMSRIGFFKSLLI